jgi:hypothetical protein
MERLEGLNRNYRFFALSTYHDSPLWPFHAEKEQIFKYAPPPV